jgi:2-polyprenyl-3-methyl-5-hydroxy-6-metoxy-1,4-benzoquinol methylase
VKLISDDYVKGYDRAFREIENTLPEEFYEAALPSYTHRNRLMSWLFWKRLDTALSLAGDPSGKSVLDFGCGSGVTFKYLNDRGASVTGCDNRTVVLARKVSEMLGTEAELFDDLFKIEGRKFDLIFALDVLEHMEDLGPFIEKFRELANDGARLIVSGPTENLLYKAGRLLAGFSGEYHVTNIFDIEKRLGDKGLKREALRVLYPPVSLFRISRWKF